MNEFDGFEDITILTKDWLFHQARYKSGPTPGSPTLLVGTFHRIPRGMTVKTFPASAEALFGVYIWANSLEPFHPIPKPCPKCFEANEAWVLA